VPQPDRRSVAVIGLVAVLAGAVVVAVLLTLRPARPPAPEASGVGAWAAGPPAPEALTEVAVAADERYVWAAGGLAADGRAVTSVHVFDTVRGEWQRGPDLPEAIHHSALVHDGSALFLIGGFLADGRPTDRVLQLQGSGNNLRWVDHVPLPDARGAGAAAWDGQGRIVYAGGVGLEAVADDVWIQVEHGWQHIGRLSEPRQHLAAASDGAGSVFFLGGRLHGLETNRAAVDIVTRGVRRVGDVATARGGVAAFWSPAHGACLVGGESPGGTNTEVECVNAGGDVVRLPALARARHGLGAAVVGGRAWVVMGGEQPGLFVSDAVEVLDLP
jgi:hypothetical protein